MPPMRRRLTALFALLSLLASALLPAHGHAHARPPRDGVPAGDLCVAGKPGVATPALPAGAPAPACDMCSGCIGGASAPPRAATALALPSPSALAVVLPVPAGPVSRAPRAALPRGPPASR